MRTFDELKKIFDILQYCNEPVSMQSDKAILIRYKWIEAIASRLYPKENGNSFHVVVDSYGDLLFDNDSVDYGEGSYIYETSLLYGNLDDYVLSYLMKSPFWDARVVYLGCEDEKKEDVSFLSFMKKCFNHFWEEELYQEMEEEEMHPLKPLYDMFGNDCEPRDSACIIKSALYPYVKKLKSVVSGKYTEYVTYINRAYQVISDWMAGADYHFETEHYGYFVCCDASSWACYYGTDSLQLNAAIIICAELIERAMFDMDDIYHFLPKQLRPVQEGGKCEK